MMNKKQLVMEAANTVIDYLYYGTDKEFCSEIAEHIQHFQMTKSGRQSDGPKLSCTETLSVLRRG